MLLRRTSEYAQNFWASYRYPSLQIILASLIQAYDFSSTQKCPDPYVDA